MIYEKKKRTPKAEAEAVLIGEEAGDREERSSGAAGAAGRDGGGERLHKFAAGAVWFGLGGHTMKSARWP